MTPHKHWYECSRRIRVTGFSPCQSSPESHAGRGQWALRVQGWRRRLVSQAKLHSQSSRESHAGGTCARAQMLTDINDSSGELLSSCVIVVAVAVRARCCFWWLLLLWAIAVESYCCCYFRELLPSCITVVPVAVGACHYCWSCSCSCCCCCCCFCCCCCCDKSCLAF